MFEGRKMYRNFKVRVILALFAVCFLAFWWNLLRNNGGKSGGIVELQSNNESDLHNTYKTKQCDSTDVNLLEEIQRMNKEMVPADDKCLVELIRRYYIIPPSLLPYNLTSPQTYDTSRGQAAFVDSLLNQKKGGFYVESGAFDGEYISNTLFFERRRSWMGVLIEPNPRNFRKLINKSRKAFLVNACLSTKDYPSEVLIDDKGDISTINQVKKTTKQTIKVQCFPIYSIMLALGRTNVDYFSLDVEGAEQGVLDNIPWNRVNIDFMSIEYDKYPGRARGLIRDMTQKGYKWLKTIEKKWVADIIVRKKSID